MRVDLGKTPLRSRDLSVDIRKTHLRCGVKGKAPIIDGELPYEIKMDESAWTLDSSRFLLINLEKVSATYQKRRSNTSPLKASWPGNQSTNYLFLLI